MIVTITHDNIANQVASITDTDGNTYQRAIGPVSWYSGTYRTEMWYAHDISGGTAALSSTVTLGAAGGNFALLYLNEYSGVDRVAPLNQTASLAGVAPLSALQISSGDRPISTIGELVFGHGEAEGPQVLLGPGFTLRHNSFGNIEEDLIAQALGPHAALFSLSASAPYVALMATFLPLSEAADAGPSGGGIEGPRRLRVGCGCAGVGSSALAGLFVACMVALFISRRFR